MPATERELKLARTQARADQAWVMWEEHLPAIERIAAGDMLPEDLLIAEGIACLVAGEMYKRRAEREG